MHDGSIRKEDPKETEREVDQLNTTSYRKQNVHLQDDDSVDFRMGMGMGGGGLKGFLPAFKILSKRVIFE